MKHLLSLEKLARAVMEKILAASSPMKKERGHHSQLPLCGQTWALIFNKSSTRTRVSFEVGIRELGGQAMFLSANDIQIGRGEPIKDTARVLGRMIHGGDPHLRAARRGGIRPILRRADRERAHGRRASVPGLVR